MELAARIPQGMGNGVANSSRTSNHTSVVMICKPKEHQNRWAESLRGGEDIMP